MTKEGKKRAPRNRKEYMRAYRRTPKCIAKQKEWRAINIERVREKQKARNLTYRLDPERAAKMKEYMKEYQARPEVKKSHKEKRYHERYADKYKSYKAKNKLKISAQRREYQRARYKNDLQYSLKEKIKSRIRTALKAGNGRKTSSSDELLGCSILQFRRYIEAQFIDGMSWENRGKWHIDHIRPCASFDLTDSEQQKACFHYTNLRPLWARSNRLKSDHFNEINHDDICCGHCGKEGLNKNGGIYVDSMVLWSSNSVVICKGMQFCNSEHFIFWLNKNSEPSNIIGITNSPLGPSA